MKNWLSISLLILLAIGITLYVMFKDIMSKIAINVALQSTSTGIKNWADVTQFFGGKGSIIFNFGIDVTNASWLAIKLRNLETTVYYKGQQIGKSSNNALRNITIDKGSYKQWVEPIELSISAQLLTNLLKDLTSGVDPELTYSTQMRIYGISYTYTDKVKIIETTLSSL